MHFVLSSSTKFNYRWAVISDQLLGDTRPSPHPLDMSSRRSLLNMSRCVPAAHCRARTDACCWEKQQQIDNNRLKISIGINNHLQIAYLAFQCLPVLYEVCHFRYRYRYRNRYRFSISIGSIGIGGIGGIVLTLVKTMSTGIIYTHYSVQLVQNYREPVSPSAPEITFIMPLSQDFSCHLKGTPMHRRLFRHMPVMQMLPAGPELCAS